MVNSHEVPCAILVVSARVSGTSAPIAPAWASTPYTISTKWVTTKPRKIGSSSLIDSLAPRRFIHSSATTTASSVPSLNAWAPGGRTLNSASTPPATEMAMVST